MALDEPAYQVQLPGCEAMISSKSKRVEPELTGLLLPLHMDMRRLVTVEAGLAASQERSRWACLLVTGTTRNLYPYSGNTASRSGSKRMRRFWT